MLYLWLFKTFRSCVSRITNHLPKNSVAMLCCVPLLSFGRHLLETVTKKWGTAVGEDAAWGTFFWLDNRVMGNIMDWLAYFSIKHALYLFFVSYRLGSWIVFSWLLWGLRWYVQLSVTRSGPLSMGTRKSIADFWDHIACSLRSFRCLFPSTSAAEVSDCYRNIEDDDVLH